MGSRATVFATSAVENSLGNDSQCLFPPLELAALVAAGVLDRRSRVLDLGCGRGVESIFLAKLGWRDVYGVDVEEELVREARRRAKRQGARVRFGILDVAEGATGLPAGWPRTYGIVLDRLCVNNFVSELMEIRDEAEARKIYFCRLAELVQAGGMAIIRDRWSETSPDGSFRRMLWNAVREKDFLPELGDQPLFRIVDGGLILNVRLVGDDTGDVHRIDAMVPVRGKLAILRRTKFRPAR